MPAALATNFALRAFVNPCHTISPLGNEDANVKKLILLFCLPLLGQVASAGTIALHNTGVDSSDALVAAGAATSFWSLSAEPAGASEALGSNPFRFHHPAYFADTSTAAWVSPGSVGNAGVLGNYTYDLVFDLTGIDPSTVAISGIFGTDNDGSISLNGNAAVATTSFGGFGSTTSFSFTSGFQAGLNRIHVVVDNGTDPTAFFVQFDSGTGNPSGVPEPTTILLTCSGLAGLALIRRIRRT